MVIIIEEWLQLGNSGVIAAIAEGLANGHADGPVVIAERPLEQSQRVRIGIFPENLRCNGTARNATANTFELFNRFA